MFPITDFNLPAPHIKLNHLAESHLINPENKQAAFFNPDGMVPLFGEMFSPQEPFLIRLNEIIENRLQDFDLCSGNLHQFVPISRATLHRRLNQMGLCASVYLSRYRIYRSLAYLSLTQYSITDVALQVGMNSSSYTRAFKNFLGQTPNKFRQLKYNFTEKK